MKPSISKLLPGSFIALVLLLLLPTAAANDTGRWRLDLANAQVSFSISVLGMFDVGGRFERVAGNILVDDNCTASAISFSIETASVTTENAERDRFLRSAALLNTDSFPLVTFTGRTFLPDQSGTGMVSGLLTLNGVSREVHFTLRRRHDETETTPASGTRFEASTRISRSAFGITALPLAVSDMISISVSVDALPENIRIAAAGS